MVLKVKGRLGWQTKAREERFFHKTLDKGGAGEYNKPNSGNRRNAMLRNAKVFFGFCYRSFFMGFGFFGVQAAGSIH